jgi:hypothetical protein
MECRVRSILAVRMRFNQAAGCCESYPLVIRRTSQALADCAPLYLAPVAARDSSTAAPSIITR